MPIFKIHFRYGMEIEPDDVGIEFPDLHRAYLGVCKAIPDTARDVLASGQDPMAFGYIICDEKGRRLMHVEAADILSPAEWRARNALRGPHSGLRSHRVRDDLALASFRRLFTSMNVGCLLLTPDLQIRDINQFCARHAHVDLEEVRDAHIQDIFKLDGPPKEYFDQFWSLAQRGAEVEIIDLPYRVLDLEGGSANGWWSARIWPIFDQNDHFIGLVELAEPYLTPKNGGQTLVGIAGTLSV